MSATVVEVEKNFLLKWTTIVSVTTLVGVALSFVSMWSVGGALEGPFGEIVVLAAAGTVFGGLIGLGVGSGQVFILRNWGVDPVRWIVASTVASALGMAAALVISEQVLGLESMPEWQAAANIGLALGVNLGVAQWLELRRKLPNAAVWIPINIVTWLGAVGVAFALDGEGREMLAFGLMAIVAAVGTGLGMTWLLGRVLPVTA